MKIIQIGTGKSGNLWLYKILQSIFKRANLEMKSLIQSHPIHPIAKSWPLSFPEQADIDYLTIEPTRWYYRISSIFQMPIDDVDDYLSKVSHVWMQSFFYPGRSEQLLSKFDKIVYIIRDPRDVAISMSRFAFTPYQLKYYPHPIPDPDTYLQKRFPDELSQWVRHVGGYLKEKERLNIHFVFYERLLSAYESEMKQLLNYLGLTLSTSVIEQIKNEVNFKSMKEKNPHHLRKGEAGGWRATLTPSQKKLVLKLARPMLSLLNYPIQEQESRIPSLPSDIDLQTIDNILSSVQKQMFLIRLKRKVSKMLWKKETRSSIPISGAECNHEDRGTPEPSRD